MVNQVTLTSDIHVTSALHYIIISYDITLSYHYDRKEGIKQNVFLLTYLGKDNVTHSRFVIKWTDQFPWQDDIIRCQRTWLQYSLVIGEREEAQHFKTTLWDIGYFTLKQQKSKCCVSLCSKRCPVINVFFCKKMHMSLNIKYFRNFCLNKSSSQIRI